MYTIQKADDKKTGFSVKRSKAHLGNCSCSFYDNGRVSVIVGYYMVKYQS